MKTTFLVIAPLSDEGAQHASRELEFHPAVQRESQPSMISRLSARGMDESEGLRGGKRREAILYF
jgi:hypothetical protein